MKKVDGMNFSLMNHSQNNHTLFRLWSRMCLYRMRYIFFYKSNSYSNILIVNCLWVNFWRFYWISAYSILVTNNENVHRVKNQSILDFIRKSSSTMCFHFFVFGLYFQCVNYFNRIFIQFFPHISCVSTLCRLKMKYYFMNDSSF